MALTWEKFVEKLCTEAQSDALYHHPIGAIYMSVDSTSPATLFGGTWAAWGAGRVPVGIKSTDTDFDTVEEEGGAKTHTNPLSNSGYAKVSGVNPDNNVHIGLVTAPSWTSDFNAPSGAISRGGGTFTNGAGLGGVTDAGSSLMPYCVCYMWKRTA